MSLKFVYLLGVVSIRHPIQVVSRITGLSQHVIRVWEKRYRAVVPGRTGTNRRLYTDEDVERLSLLTRATGAGHKISIIARLGVEDLRQLVATVSRGEPVRDGGLTDTGGRRDVLEADREPSRSKKEGFIRRGGAAGVPAGVGGGTEAAGDSELVEEAVLATTRFDGETLMRVLEAAVIRFGHNGMLHRVVCPLARETGERWQRGQITAAHEHFASGIIRDFLARTARPFSLGEVAPCAVVTTPAGQLHELGAVIVAAAAGNLGWRVIYLGASLPAAEIAGAVRHNRARALLLSIVYPSDDPRLPEELVMLRRLMPQDSAVLVGGRAAAGYSQALRQIGAVQPGNLVELCDLLEQMRFPRVEG